LERNDQDLEEQYEGYLFDFNADGTLEVTSGTGTFDGTWEAEGTANEITMTISIPDLEDFNASWRVQEIEREDDESEIELTMGDDELSFETNCSQNDNGDGSGDNSGNPDLSSYLTEGSWSVSTYLDAGTDETQDFTAYTFVFQENGVVTADNGNTTNGTWIIQESGDKLLLDFGTTIPLDEFNEDWEVVLASETQIELRDISGGDGTTDTLIFTKQ
jgi:hypothetical protein